MTHPQPSASGQRTSEEVARERATGEVSDVLLNLEHTITRARSARKVVTEEIQEALRRFGNRWSGYVGTERSAAQTFLRSPSSRRSGRAVRTCSPRSRSSPDR